jgi:hypothetical protein
VGHFRLERVAPRFTKLRMMLSKLRGFGRLHVRNAAPLRALTTSDFAKRPSGPDLIEKYTELLGQSGSEVALSLFASTPAGAF